MNSIVYIASGNVLPSNKKSEQIAARDSIDMTPMIETSLDTNAIKQVLKLLNYDSRFLLLHSINIQKLILNQPKRDLLLQYVASFGDDYQNDLLHLERYLLSKNY